MKKSQLAILVSILILPTTIFASQGDSWEFEVTPYLWAVGKSGETGQRKVLGGADAIADLDMSFKEIFERLDSAFLLEAQARKGNFTTWLDFIHMTISDSSNAPLGGAEVEIQENLFEFAVAYQLPQVPILHLYAGGRYIDTETDIDLRGLPIAGPLARIKIGEDWIDPLLGLKVQHVFAHDWQVILRGDLGGFGVGSDLSWQALAMVQYHINDLLSVKLAYRYLDVDYDDNGFVYDLSTSGILLGLGFSF